MLEAVLGRAARVGQQLVGPSCRGSEILAAEGVGRQRAEGDGAEVCALAQTFQHSPAFGGEGGIGRGEAQCGQVKLIHFVGRLEPGGGSEMEFGFVQFVQADRQVGCNHVKGRQVCGPSAQSSRIWAAKE